MFVNAERVEKDLREGGWILHGHFVLSSLAHSNTYANVKKLPGEITYDYCYELARRFQNRRIDIVTGPSTGADILCDQTAYHLGKMYGRSIRAVRAHKDNDNPGEFYISPEDQAFIKDSHILSLDDVWTSAKSHIKVNALLESLGGIIVGVGAIVNRNVSPIVFGNVEQVEHLLHLNPPKWEADLCPLCLEDKVPINETLGKGAAFMAQQRLQKTSA